MISAILITLNEQENIRQALESLVNLADEVIIIDSGSEDRTLEIAKTFGAKTYFRKFDNFANQKNFALSKATNEWILALDADEEIPADLAKEIINAVEDKQYAGYLMPRRNFILGKEIKYSRWSPDRHIWLWRRDAGKWVGDIHEEVIVSGKVGLLKHSKIHNSHKNISEFMQANEFYSSLEAKALFKNKTSFSFWNMIGSSLFEFFIRFLYKKGFLDGKQGFSLAYLMGIYKITVWIKLWELQRIK